jgi:dipeptidyl aminopeptidase/acylaminoacyl peptidase
MTKLFSRSILLLVLFSLVATSCASRNAPSLTDLAQKYHPTRIATGVQTGPGSLAWSPDGKALAYINGQVNLDDIDSAERKTIPIAAPHFLCWLEEGRLFVLYQEQGRDALLSMDRRGEDPMNIAVNDGAEAIYCAANTGDLLVLAKKITSFTYGTAVTFRVSAHDRRDRPTKNLYTIDKSYPWKQLDLRRLLAWTHAGLNPVDNSLLVIEYAKPPAFAPLSRVISVDPVSGEAAEIFSNGQRTVYTSASWSPDGRSLALTDGEGMLRIQTAKGEWTIPDQASTGFYPTWNPKGGKVYSGGSVYDLDAKNSEPLLTQGAWSIAQWSPDGTKLAVIADGELWLFSGFLPSSSRTEESIDKTLAKKMSLLQHLFREGLMTPEEYKERRNGLMKKPEATR